MSTVVQNETKEKIARGYELQRKHKVRAKNTSASYRLEKLKRFKSLLLAKKSEIAQALKSDFAKPELETDLTEIMPVISLINLMEKKLVRWMSDEKVSTPLLLKGAKSWIRREGKGNCLIISPWNYPFQLSVYPVLTAFAAGNTCMLKPSEYTPATNKIVADLLSRVFDPEEVTLIEGDASVSKELLELDFDHIFFTGSTQVGRVVMQAAARNLSGVSLELGGKSPCVIDKSAQLEKVIRRLSWGKVVNAGQTCVAPDYLIVHEDIHDKVVELIVSDLKKFYKDRVLDTDSYCQIISTKHCQRLVELIDDAKTHGAHVAYGAQVSEDKRGLSPTLLTQVKPTARIMQEEIFGPVLPIIKYRKEEEVLEMINGKDNALAMYIFSEDQDFCDRLMNSTFNGGVTINDTLINVGHPTLPFGGAGKSGIGRYHGKYGFDEFSNLRAVMQRKADLGVSYFYPPYNAKKNKLVDSLLRRFSGLF